MDFCLRLDTGKAIRKGLSFIPLIPILPVNFSKKKENLLFFPWVCVPKEMGKLHGCIWTSPHAGLKDVQRFKT